MNECMNVEAREALPDLLHGRLSALDTVTMKAHVDSCAACRTELALLRGIRDSRLVPAIDVERIAAAIPAYGGAAPAVPQHERVSRMTRFGTLRVAAAAVLLAAGGWALSIASNSDRANVPDGGSVAAAAPVMVNTPSPTASIAETASASVATVEMETQFASLSLIGGTDGLSDSDLEQLASDIESIDAVPSAEPQSVTLTVDDMGMDQ